MWVDELFPEGVNEISFMSFFGVFVSARAFYTKTDTRMIDFEAFKSLLGDGFVAGRVGEYCEYTWIPTQEEVEKASHTVHHTQSDKDYFGNYNNLIFLQKKHHAHHRHRRSEAKSKAKTEVKTEVKSKSKSEAKTEVQTELKTNKKESENEVIDNIEYPDDGN